MNLSQILEILAENNLLDDFDDFYAAAHDDNFKRAGELMNLAGVGSKSMKAVIEMMKNADGFDFG